MTKTEKALRAEIKTLTNLLKYAVGLLEERKQFDIERNRCMNESLRHAKMELFGMNDPQKYKDDELVYSADQYCHCGYGLAYPKHATVQLWTCSGVLKGVKDTSVEHFTQVPVCISDIESELDTWMTTRKKYQLPDDRDAEPAQERATA